MQKSELTYEAVEALPSPKLSVDIFASPDLISSVPLPELVLGDKIRLQQVLVNLIKNALKFSYGKPIMILALYDYAKKKLKVQVRDQGCGISKDDLSLLFTLFGKGKASERVNQEGIGMGLVICQKIVENSNGSINCYSDGPQKGSCFAFSIEMGLPKRYI